MYEGKTESTLISSMLSQISNNYSKVEGSFLYDLIAAISVELGVAYTELERVLALAFAQTTSGTYLEYKAAERGLTRKSATASSGIITITGTTGTVIPAGSLFETVGGVQFKALEFCTISTNGNVIITVEAVLTGSSGNVAANTITKITTGISGVTAVINPSAMTGGTDIETDDALLERLLEEVQKPISSGNKYHYEKWAKEISGVGDAKCIPLWNGAGTVKVVLVDSEKLPANGTIVALANTYIQSQRPIGANVTVVAANVLSISITAKIVINSNVTIEDVIASFETALTEYLAEQAFSDTAISYLKIGGILLKINGVISASQLEVNGGTSDIVLADDEIAVAGTVNLIE